MKPLKTFINYLKSNIKTLSIAFVLIGLIISTLILVQAYQYPDNDPLAVNAPDTTKRSIASNTHNIEAGTNTLCDGCIDHSNHSPIYTITTPIELHIPNPTDYKNPPKIGIKKARTLTQQLQNPKVLNNKLNYIIYTLLQIPPTDPIFKDSIVLKNLAQALYKQKPYFQSQVAYLMGIIKPDHHRIHHALSDLFYHSEPSVRHTSVWAVKNIVPQDPTIRMKLYKISALDDIPEIRKEANQALMHIKHKWDK